MKPSQVTPYDFFILDNEKKPIKAIGRNMKIKLQELKIIFYRINNSRL